MLRISLSLTGFLTNLKIDLIVFYLGEDKLDLHESRETVSTPIITMRLSID